MLHPFSTPNPPTPLHRGRRHERHERRHGRLVDLTLALVAFGDRGLILTVAAKPTVPKWTGETLAVRMDASFALRSFAKQDVALVIATTAHVAWA